MKTTILALLLLTNIAMAQMPCTNDCAGEPANPTMPPPIPLEALQLRIRPTEVGLSNTLANNLYQIEGSTNLLDWIPLTGSFTNSLGAEKVFSWTNGLEEIGVFRARDVTTNWIYEEVYAYVSTLACSGPVIGRAIYYTDPPLWGFPVNSNTVVHMFADGTGRTNSRIEAEGRYGDFHCAISVLWITNPISAYYRFTIYFKDNLPDTNVDYVAIMRGFLP